MEQLAALHVSGHSVRCISESFCVKIEEVPVSEVISLMACVASQCWAVQGALSRTDCVSRDLSNVVTLANATVYDLNDLVKCNIQAAAAHQ